MPQRPAPAARARIVIVDDIPSVRMLVGALLRHAGFCVVGEAGCGERALALCRELRPHAVLLDYKLPDISGLEVLERLKNEAPRTRVVLITASGERTVVEQAIARRSDGYIVKPFTPGRMLQELDRLFPPASFQAPYRHARD